MRIRNFMSYLQEQQLVNEESLSQLKGKVIGIDAVYWLRNIGTLKDPLAYLIGGVPLNLKNEIKLQTKKFISKDIKPVFVFSGISPRGNIFFRNGNEENKIAWGMIQKGEIVGAANILYVCSRINQDMLEVTFHLLKAYGFDVIQSPYLSSTQLSLMAGEGCFDCVFGPPTLMLFGFDRVILDIDFTSGVFEWFDANHTLEKWSIGLDDLIDVCLLAGNDMCLTYPYLNLERFHTDKKGFSFGTVIDFIRQSPIHNYMNAFPTPEMKEEHIQCYSRCKTLILLGMGLNRQGELTIYNHLNKSDLPLPSDYQEIVGSRLPRYIYILLFEGILSSKVVSVLSSGEWVTYSKPSLDSMEFKEFLYSMTNYRAVIIGLLMKHMGEENYKSIDIITKLYNDSEVIEEEKYQMKPSIPNGINWYFTSDKLNKEITRQKSSVDLQFCLKWHFHSKREDSTLWSNGGDIQIEDTNMLLAYVHLMILEHLEYFSHSGNVTAFGARLINVPREMQEDVLIALELTKSGLLNGDILEGCNTEYYLSHHKSSDMKPVLLISRVFSLRAMDVKSNAAWLSRVDYDLAAYHRIVRLLKRTLRQLVQSCFASVLIPRLHLLHELPIDLMKYGSPKVPCFYINRNCLGIVTKYILEYKLLQNPGSSTNDEGVTNKHNDANILNQLESDITAEFPLCLNPIADFIEGIHFWIEIKKILCNLDANREYIDSVIHADQFLWQRCNTLKLNTHALWPLEFNKWISEYN